MQISVSTSQTGHVKNTKKWRWRKGAALNKRLLTTGGNAQVKIHEEINNSLSEQGFQFIGLKMQTWSTMMYHALYVIYHMIVKYYRLTIMSITQLYFIYSQ